jgi:hypothetical protein
MYHKSEPPKIHDISKVLDFAIEYNPILAAKDISTIYYWMNEGATEADILAAMKKVTQWKKGVSSFNYFTNPVMAMRDVRMAEEKANAAKPAVDSDYCIKIYKWKKERGMALTSEQEAALAAYEQQKSPIG